MSGNNDLKVTKVIKAPPYTVWKAWREPEHFVKWWASAPVRTVSNKHEFHAGGAFDTTMHLPDGTVMEGGEGCFLEVIENERIVFTDALQGGWRPNETAFFTAVKVTGGPWDPFTQMEDGFEGVHPNKTKCMRAILMK